MGSKPRPRHTLDAASGDGCNTPGMRVGAWLDADSAQVRLLGYGVYVGDEIPSADAGGVAPLARAAGVPNPKIQLDNGKIVWGAECWWGPEAIMRDKIGGRTVVDVDIDEIRQLALGA